MPKQEKAIAALLSTSAMKDAAARSGINEGTLWRWLQLPEFAASYRAARRQVVERATFRSPPLMPEVVQTGNLSPAIVRG